MASSGRVTRQSARRQRQAVDGNRSSRQLSDRSLTCTSVKGCPPGALPPVPTIAATAASCGALCSAARAATSPLATPARSSAAQDVWTEGAKGGCPPGPGPAAAAVAAPAGLWEETDPGAVALGGKPARGLQGGKAEETLYNIRPAGPRPIREVHRGTPNTGQIQFLPPTCSACSRVAGSLPPMCWTTGSGGGREQEPPQRGAQRVEGAQGLHGETGHRRVGDAWGMGHDRSTL
jgi:hypothetical protein